MRFLCSYWSFANVRILDVVGARSHDLMADSGGFSAMNSGAPVTLDGYVGWLRENSGQFTSYACLDVIGDLAQTARNLESMERRGLRPFGVIHAMQPHYELRRLVRRLDHVAFGGMVPFLGRSSLPAAFNDWLRRAWDVVLDEQARSGRTIRVHGFGCTRLDTVVQWPWDSVDSTSWKYGMRFADLQLFLPDEGRFVLVNLFEVDSVYRHRRCLLETYMVEPSVLACRARYQRSGPAMRVAAQAYIEMEKWVWRTTGRRTRVYLASSPEDIRKLQEDFA